MTPETPPKTPAKTPPKNSEVADSAGFALVSAGRGAFIPKTPQSRLPKGASALRSPVRSPRDELRYSLARRLTDRDREIVRLVARLRVLTTDQIVSMFFSDRRTALNRLLALHRLGVLDRFRPFRPNGGENPYHYVLGPLGAAILAADNGDDPDRAIRRWKPERALAIGRTQRLAHFTGVNGIFAALVAYARTAEGARLDAWLTESECARWCEGIVRPDAFGEWCERSTSVEFFLEYDRGTENLRRLVDKLAGYEHLEAERGASAWVLFAFLSVRRESAARRALADSTVPVATGVLTPSARPPDALWSPLGSDDNRLRLVDLSTFPKPEAARLRVANGSLRAWRFDRSRFNDDEEAPIEHI